MRTNTPISEDDKFNPPGITRIFGEVIAVKDNTFQVMQSNGEPVTIQVPSSITHMLRGIKRGVHVQINNTPSGPKTIMTHGSRKVENILNGTKDRARDVAMGAIRSGEEAHNLSA